MSLTEIVASIDREIALLRKARALLAGSGAAQRAARVPAAAAPPAKAPARKKTRLSPEGRRRIAEAVKRRWEAERKAKASAQRPASK